MAIVNYPMLPVFNPPPRGRSRGGDGYLQQISTFQHEICMCLEIEKWGCYLMQGPDSIYILLAGQTTTTTILCTYIYI